MVNSQNIIGEYLYKIGWQVDKMPNIENALQTIKFIELARALTDVTKVLFELGKGMATFVDKVVKADMQTQIFAKRILTTTQNARSLQSVMGAMGLNSLSELRDVALNPTLRAQFLSLRNFTRGLEPGAGVKSGIDNFREVSFQLQKINVLLSYFSQFVVGTLGEMLKGPMKSISLWLDNFARDFKNNIQPWAAQVATVLGYIFRFLQTAYEIGREVFRLMGDWKIGWWLRGLMDVVLIIMFTVRDILKWMNDMWPFKKNPVPAAVGIGAGVGGAGALATGGSVVAGVAGGAAVGGGAGVGIVGGYGIAKWLDDNTQVYKSLDKMGLKSIRSNLQSTFGFGNKGGSGGTDGGLKGANEGRVISYLTKQGYSLEGAAAILANAKAESGLRPGIVGDHGTSVGLFQWHNERWKRGSKFIGKNLKDGSLEEQLGYLMHELRAYYPSLHKNLKTHMPASELAGQFVRDFERPADVAGQSRYRGKLAKGYHDQIVVNINGYNRDPRELSSYVKETLTTRVVQPATP